MNDWEERMNKLNQIVKLSDGKLVIAELGGGLKGFWLLDDSTHREIIFGYANGVLGYELLNAEGNQMEADDLGDDDMTPREEYELIIQTLAKYRFPL